MTDDALRVEGISKRYQLGQKVRRELWALRDVTFSVPRGSILGVIGANGAGKTTLLKVIARITRPTAGTVSGCGRVVPLLALGAGFQPDLTGRENVFMNAAMYGVAAADVEEHLDEIIEFAGIGDFIDVPVKRYSSGMYLRLAFSVAINMRPQILLADEVLAVGDLEFQERCLERVAEAGETGMSVLFVSHDMEAIRRLCDRVLWLQQGEIAGIGSPGDITSAYENAAWTQAAGTKKRGRNAASAGGDILFVKLTSNGREVGAARVSDDVSVEIGLHIRQANVVVRPRIELKARGVLAFRSVAPSAIEVAAPGHLTARVGLPPHLLAETTYSIDVGVSVVRGEEEFPILMYNALSFQVYDTAEASSARGTFTGQFPGVVRPRLDWSVVPGRQPAAMGNR